MIKRRRLLQFAAATVAAVPSDGMALIFRGGVGAVGGGSTLLTTLTAQNTSGSTVSANFVTQPIGLTFKAGDIPSGTYPQVQLTDGTPCPMNVDAITRFADGSIKHCTSPGILVPTSIAGSGSLTLNVLNGGSAPAASALSISNLTTRDLKVILAGITNLSGTWTASLNDVTEVEAIGNGPAGLAYRIMCHFKQSGSAHGQLECYFYVYAVQNSVGGLYRIRLMPAIAQPWYDINSPAKALREFTATVQDGATVIQTMGPAVQAITTTSGDYSILATGHTFQNLMGVRLSAAPTGFSTGYTYGVIVIDANHIYLYDPATAGPNHNPTTPASNTSANLTFDILASPFTKQFGANGDGTYLSIQGGGSATAEPTVRVVQDKTYLRSTRQFPPYDVAATPIAESVPLGGSNIYSPNGRGLLDPTDTNAGGDHAYIGPLSSTSSTRFILDSSTAEQNSRVTALNMSEMWNNLRYSGTNTVPVLNNGSNGAGTPYPNMGPLFPATAPGVGGGAFFWNGSIGSPFTAPAGIEAGFINLTPNHYPNFHYLEWMLTGEPQYADMMADSAIYQQCSRTVQRIDVGGTAYYGTTLQDDFQIRTDAWAVREPALAAWGLPDNYWDGETKQYFTDCIKASFDAIVAFNATQSTIWKDNGFYFFTVDQGNCGAQTWQYSYLMESVAFAYGVGEYGNALAFLNHLLKFPSGVKSNTGSLFSYTSYQFSCRSGASAGSTVVTSMDEIHYAPGGDDAGAWSTDGSTTIFITNNGTSPFTLTDGDRIQWWDAQHGGAPPTGPTIMVSYFAKNVSDPGPTASKTCQVAATLGGTAIAAGADNGGFIGIRFQVIPASPTGLNYDNVGGHVANARCAFRYATAVGATLSGGILADMEGYFNNAGVTFNGDALSKYCVVSAF